MPATGRLDSMSALDLITDPRSVVVVGASSDEFAMSGAPLHNLRRHGYGGEMFAVNPNTPHFPGVTTVASLDELPKKIDTAVVVTPAGAVPGVLDELVAVTSTATIISSGFDDSRPDGMTRAALGARIGTCGLRVLGPNTAGLINVTRSYCPRAARNHPPALVGGPVALVTHSGGVGNTIFNRAQTAGMGIGLFVSAGDSLDLSVWDVARYAIARAGATTLMLVVEGALPATELSDLAATADAHSALIVLCRMGRTRSGQRAAQTHTGALAGPAATELAAARALGMWVVSDLDDVWQVGWLLQRWGRQPAGRPRRLGILAFSGGLGVEAADLAEEYRFEVPPLAGPDPATGATGANPFDAGGAMLFSDPDRVLAVTRAMDSDPSVDALVIATPLMHEAVGRRLAAGVFPKLRGTHGVISNYGAGGWTETSAAILREADLPLFDGLRNTFRALAAFRDGAGQRDGYVALPEPGTGPAVALSYWKSQAVLEDLGVPFPRRRLAGTPEEATAALATLGPPMVMKASTTEVHKTAAGLVALDVRTATQATDSFHTLTQAAGAIGGRCEGIVCEEQVGAGVDLIVGGRTDERFGPLLTVGTGGWLAESAADARIVLPPFAPESIRRTFDQTDVGAFLASGRSGLPEQLIELVVALGSALTKGEMSEFELNPVRVAPGTGSLFALDAVVLQAAE